MKEVYVEVVQPTVKAGVSHKRIQRVAAYCRVSTDDKEQLSSYENQIVTYTDRIQTNPDWEFVGVFADEGITGTSTKKRADFNRLINLCRRGKVDTILTKSISRFSRNTLDCISNIRQLRDLGVNIIFEKEGINTATMGSEMISSMVSLSVPGVPLPLLALMFRYASRIFSLLRINPIRSVNFSPF